MPVRVAFQPTFTGESANESCPNMWLEGEVPTVDELRLQVQREREAFIGRSMADKKLLSAEDLIKSSRIAEGQPQKAAG